MKKESFFIGLVVFLLSFSASANEFYLYCQPSFTEKDGVRYVVDPRNGGPFLNYIFNLETNEITRIHPQDNSESYKYSGYNYSNKQIIIKDFFWKGDWFYEPDYINVFFDFKNFTITTIYRGEAVISTCPNFQELANLLEGKLNEDRNTIIAASSGTGFFVSTNGHMVTNNHVIESCDMVKAHYKGRELDADVLFQDRANDLAIIKANIKPNKVFAVSNEDVSLLEDIIVAGYPLGKNISASIKTFKGSVTALAGYGDNFSNFQIDASLSSGNSGGPIINQKGNVVGVAVEKLVELGVEGFNFGVKSSTLKTFASSNQFKFQDPSTEELSNNELGQLITEATIYLECWMSVAKIKQIIEEGERQKAFFSEYK